MKETGSAESNIEEEIRAGDHTILSGIISARRPAAEADLLAQTLLQRFGNLRRVMTADRQEWQPIAGMKPDIEAEISRIMNLVKALVRADMRREPVIDAMHNVIEYCRLRFGDSAREHLCGLYLNRDYRLIADAMLQSGTVNHVTVYPREILRHALVVHASRIILVHNHPSGSAQPSRADISMTAELASVAERLGIDIADHVILGGSDSFSFRENGMLGNTG